MTTQISDTFIEGVVTDTDDHGFQLANRDGWLNVSKYAEPPVRIPEQGQPIEIGLDKGGLQARALQRAHDQRVHVFAIPSRPGCSITKSKTDASVRYSLVAGFDGLIGGSCQGFADRQSYEHPEALRNRLAREATRRVGTCSGLHASQLEALSSQTGDERA